MRPKQVPFICPICSKEFYRHASQITADQPKCSRTCAAAEKKASAGSKHHLWKGGKSQTRGYILIADPTGKNRYQFEHRVVMEHHLGRKLSRKEVIHHINGDKTDNRIENLQVTTQGKHAAHHNRIAYKPKPCLMCEEVATTRGLCTHHYDRLRRARLINIIQIHRPYVHHKRKEPKPCHLCPTIAVTQGFCNKHYKWLCRHKLITTKSRKVSQSQNVTTKIDP